MSCLPATSAIASTKCARATPRGSIPKTMIEAELRRRVWGDEQLFYETNQHALREIKAAFYSGRRERALCAVRLPRATLVNTSRLRGRHPLHQRSYLDLKLRLGDHLLGDHGDRMMLMNSVEGRYPFLDQDVVEFVRTLSPDFKLRSGVEKYAVKRAAEPFVPKAIIDREKFGFRAPASPFPDSAARRVDRGRAVPRPDQGPGVLQSGVHRSPQGPLSRRPRT